MDSKTRQVRAELVKCEAWYANMGEDIRLLTERTEELWFQIDDLVCVLQEAEVRGDSAEVKRCMQTLIRCSLALQTEVQGIRLKSVH
jgi:hypothetical protein